MERRSFLKYSGLSLALNQSLFAQNETVKSSEIKEKLGKSVQFFQLKVAHHGGYVYRYSADLQKCEGEGQTGPDTIWVQPPGTPSVGMAMLEIYQKTGLNEALQAAVSAGHALVNGQLQSGLWTDRIEFEPSARKRFAYRVDGKPGSKSFNTSTFDDDKSQSAVRFLLRLNDELKGGDQRIRESLDVALGSIIKAQYPNGGFAQGFSEPADESRPAGIKAAYPETWPRVYPGGKYWNYYTFNDGNIDRIIETLILASQIQNDEKYLNAAIKTGEFILNAQMPAPQPGWAQQYNFEMQPVWARKFEPTAISGGETQGVINTLIDLFIETGDKRFLSPIPQSLDWIEKSALPDGKVARFYELQSNRPLYFNRKYELTYEPNDLPTHYGFIVANKSASLRKKYEKAVSMNERQRIKERDSRRVLNKVKQVSDIQVNEILQAMDDRGAWVEEGKLSYYPKSDPTQLVISSTTFIRNATILADWLLLQGRKP